MIKKIHEKKGQYLFVKLSPPPPRPKFHPHNPMRVQWSQSEMECANCLTAPMLKQVMLREIPRWAIQGGFE